MSGGTACTRRRSATGGPTARPTDRDALDLPGARSLDSNARSSALALRRSVERVRSGYHDDSIRLLARRVRLLPPIGESSGPARAANRRLPRRSARSIVGRALHGAAADQLLAGLRPRLARRPAVRAREMSWTRAAPREADLSRGRMTPAWTHAIATCVAVTREQFREGRAVCDGVSGRLRIELRLTWLGGLPRVGEGRARAGRSA